MRNVVLVTFDSLRADHCGFMGYDRDTTPALDEMATEGVAFRNAIAPASRTNPAMAGAFTGEPLVVRDRVANPEHARRHLQRHSTLAERLSEAGYTTGAFCPNAYASRYYGFDRGFDHFEDFLFSKSSYQSLFNRHLTDSSVFTAVRNLRNYVRRQEAFKTWDTYIDEIEEWVEGQSQPFFLWTFSLDTHFPYLTPRSHRRWSGLVDMYYYNWRCNRLIDQLDIDLDDRTRQHIIDIYDDAIRFADGFIRELRERLAEYDPVIVIHGDHGEAFDEHGTYGHFYPALYEENVHVPFVAWDGDETATVTEPVSLLDLPEVTRRVAGISEDAVSTIGEPWVFATDYDGRGNRNLTAVRTARGKYIRTEHDDDTTQNELYDLAADPVEETNLIGGDRSFEGSFEQLVGRRTANEAEILAIRHSVLSQPKLEAPLPGPGGAA